MALCNATLSTQAARGDEFPERRSSAEKRMRFRHECPPRQNGDLMGPASPSCTETKIMGQDRLRQKLWPLCHQRCAILTGDHSRVGADHPQPFDVIAQNSSADAVPRRYLQVRVEGSRQ